MDIRIGVIGYGEFSSLVDSFRPSIPAGIDLVVRNGIFDDAVRQAKEMDGDDGVDVFVSAGSNGMTLRSQVHNPYVNISVTGVDFLEALRRAKALGRAVGVVTFRDPLPFMSLMAEMVSVPIVQRVYTSGDQLDLVLDELWDMRVREIVGSSLVNERARSRGFHCHFIYSQDSMRTGILQAHTLACARKRELMRSTQLKTILQSTREGVVATDRDGVITVFNESAQAITGIPEERALGNSITQVLHNTRLDKVLQKGLPELNQIQMVGDTPILTNRVPIVVKNRITGAVATFQHVDTVRKAERKIRTKLQGEAFAASCGLEDILGRSPAIRAAVETARTYAATEAPVLLTGETGTGKELFAQGIHRDSARKSRPFVAVNCAAIPPSLLESELFGYEDGAFTGAKKGGRSGFFELAHTGTIFLDEVGEMDRPAQARLLRVLELGQLFRVGGEQVTQVDVRVIAATNRDLEAMVASGGFREDLYYRLNVLGISLPPLRDRAGDAALLFRHFLAAARPGLSPAEMDAVCACPALCAHPWPGNVRELKNAAQRFGVLYRQGDDPASVLAKSGVADGRRSREGDRIHRMVRECGGNKAEAARRLGWSRSTLWRKLRELEENPR